MTLVFIATGIAAFAAITARFTRHEVRVARRAHQ